MSVTRRRPTDVAVPATRRITALRLTALWLAALWLAALWLPPPVRSQPINLDEITANEEFRWGVVSLHNGRFHEAIESLNRSLSFASERTLTRYWLGRAYYYAGFEEAALNEWRWVAERGSRTSVLDKWIERVELSRGLTTERLGTAVSPGRYVTMIDLPGRQADLTLFRSPTNVRPRSDGSSYVASFATHTVVLLDPNGVRRRVIDGGIEGFDRPFDVLALPDGSLLVSEFGANRIARVSADGFKVGSFGRTGIGPGELLGPQYLASDGQGHVYVSDHGNGRVSKFTTDGEFLFSFGGRGTSLRSFSPAGIVVTAGRVYVADTVNSRIAVFDESGNYLGEIRTPLMDRPEGLSLYEAGSLLVSDAYRIYVIGIERETVALLTELNPNRRLLGAAIDANRNLLAADINSSSILFLAASEELYTGLNVEVESVSAVEHPRVYAAVTVTDRNGEPVLGLGPSNFRITEDRFPTGPLTVEYAGYRSGETVLSLLVDPWAAGREDREAARAAALEMHDALRTGDRLWVVGAGDHPVLESEPGAGRLAVGEASERASVYPTESGRLDLGIRLAVYQLLGELGRRGLVIVSNGELSPHAFDAYSLAETAAHLRNNHVSLHVVYTGRNAVNAELEFLAEATGGSASWVYQPRGVGPVVDAIRRSPSGTYLLSYNSVHNSDFGRAYIPLEVEAYLLQRSGRDEVGYFGPLEF